MHNLVVFGTGDAPPLAPLVGGFPASPKIKKNKIMFFFIWGILGPYGWVGLVFP
jgi:hypothetical protein